MGKDAYAKAGVDIHAGDEAVQKMRSAVEATYTPQVLTGLGGFGSVFEIPAGYKHPVLVSGTDGVGTKLLLAIGADKHDTIGQDLVAMVMNDIIAEGAKPLFYKIIWRLIKCVRKQLQKRLAELPKQLKQWVQH